MNACRRVYGVTRLGDSRAAGGCADDPAGGVPVQPPTVPRQEQRPLGTFADGQVDRPGRARRQRDGHYLAALASDDESPVAALEAQVLDVGAGGFGDRSPFRASSEISA